MSGSGSKLSATALGYALAAVCAFGGHSYVAAADHFGPPAGSVFVARRSPTTASQSQGSGWVDVAPRGLPPLSMHRDGHAAEFDPLDLPEPGGRGTADAALFEAPARTHWIEPAAWHEPAVEGFRYAPRSPQVRGVSPRSVGSRLGASWQSGKYKILEDHKNFYTCDTLRKLAYGVALGSILANTSMDEDFQDWYQQDVRSSATNDVAAFCKVFGDGRIFIPAFAGLALVGSMYDDTPCGSVLGELGSRTTRSYLVGAPPMLVMQLLLGGSRPGETTSGSHWKPFDDSNAVSGHAFGGAIPFINAAKMADNLGLKSGLYFCSTWTAWSRVNDDHHYLSQACLGWWMAYLTCTAIDRTELGTENVTFMPVASPNMLGVGMVYRR